MMETPPARTAEVQPALSKVGGRAQAVSTLCPLDLQLAETAKRKDRRHEMIATVVEEMDALLHEQSKQGTNELELELDLEYSTEVMERSIQVKGETMETQQATMAVAVLVKLSQAILAQEDPPHPALLDLQLVGTA